MRILTFVLIVLSLFACSERRNKEIRTFYKDKIGESIVLPDSFIVKNLETDSAYSYTDSRKFVHSKKLRIVTTINGDCHVCVNQLKQWDSIMKKLPIEKIRFLFFVYAGNYARFEWTNNAEIHFRYPVVFDYKNDFVLQNNMMGDKLLNTMLIDSTGKIMVIGNPLESQEILGLYEDAIENQRDATNSSTIGSTLLLNI